MKKYLFLLIIPFMIFGSCVKDESAYLPQQKEDVKIDEVTPEEGGEDPDVPVDGILTPGIHLIKLTVDGEERRFKYFMPVSIDPTKPISLVFELHGSYEIKAEAETIPDPIQGINSTYAICQAAIKENNIVVFPAGTNNGSSVDWSEDGYMKSIPFFDAMIDFFKRSSPTIDVNRIYTTGQSSGAIFSCTLAFYRSEVLAGIAPRAGRMSIKEQTDYPPVAVPIRMFLGMKDETVNHEGSVKDMILWAEKIGGYFPIDMEMSETPFEVEKYNKKVHTRKFNGAKAPIEIYSIEDEGHNVNSSYMMPYITEFFKANVKTQGEEPLFTSSEVKELKLDENQVVTVGVNYNDDAEFSFNQIEDWDITLNNKVLTIKAPGDFLSCVSDAVLTLTSKRGAKEATRTIKLQLQPTKTYFNVGDIYKSNDKVIGVVFWVNSKNKREAKIINLQEVTTNGTYETINYGDFGKFYTPDENDGEGNSTKSLQEKADKNLPNLTDKSSALIWAAEYTYEGVNGWYLPAMNELKALNDNISVLNPLIVSVGGKAIEPAKAGAGSYLSSTVKQNGTSKEFFYFDFFAKKVSSQVAATNSAFYRARAIKRVTL